MPKSKSTRKNKKYRPTTGRIPVGLMHKLEVPESRIQKLKQKHDAALLRMYLGPTIGRIAASSIPFCALANRFASMSKTGKPLPPDSAKPCISLPRSRS